MTKDEFLELIRSARTQWQALLAEIPERKMSEPGVAGEWSLKDILAHIAWYYHEMIGVMQAHALVGSELWYLPPDERNAVIFEQNRGRDLQEVLAEFNRFAAQLLEAVASLSEEDLTKPRGFKDMPSDWVPWRVIAGNAYLHDEDHIRSVREWMGKNGIKMTSSTTKQA